MIIYDDMNIVKAYVSLALLALNLAGEWTTTRKLQCGEALVGWRVALPSLVSKKAYLFLYNKTTLFVQSFINSVMLGY